MKIIWLTQGQFTLVDDEDYVWLNGLNWYAKKDKNTFYAVRYENGIIVKMHRKILGLIDPKILGDHKDRNGLNNQRNNLRIANYHQNALNKKATGASKYLGVFANTSTYKNRTYRYWQASIRKNGLSFHLGCFKNEELAAIAYNNAAKEIHGEFANLNVI